MDPRRERTYLMFKPDGLQRGVVGEIISRLEKKGFRLLAMKLTKATKEILDKHYAEHIGKPFFEKLCKYIMSGPVICMVWQGRDIVKTARKMMGATNPLNAEPGTIRGDYCIDSGRNIIHGSDSVESAEREIGIWFKPEEILDYKREVDTWVYEDPL